MHSPVERLRQTRIFFQIRPFHTDAFKRLFSFALDKYPRFSSFDIYYPPTPTRLSVISALLRSHFTRQMAPKKNNNNATHTSSSQNNTSADATQGDNQQQQRNSQKANNNKAKNGRIGGDGPRAKPVHRSARAVRDTLVDLCC